jgi:sarcosine oxidase subunit gamma
VAELALAPKPALAGVLAAGRHGRPDGPPGVTICERANLTLISVIARKGESEALAALVKSAYGISLPGIPRRSGGPMPDGRELSFIWSGPGQWLAYAEGVSGLAGELEIALGRRAMVVEQSDGRCVVHITGPKARAVLAKGIGIDLDPRALKPGDVALTLASHIAVQLWQIDDKPSYEIACFRSLAGSLWHWLSACAAEFGYEVVEERR